MRTVNQYEYRVYSRRTINASTTTNFVSAATIFVIQCIQMMVIRATPSNYKQCIINKNYQLQMLNMYIA